MRWSDSATSPIFGGNTNFQPFTTKAQLLQKIGKTAEADALMKSAMPMANMQELHQYGRQLLIQKKNKEALEVFKMNASKNPISLQHLWVWLEVIPPMEIIKRFKICKTSPANGAEPCKQNEYRNHDREA